MGQVFGKSENIDFNSEGNNNILILFRSLKSNK